jgi:hypothetical protein
MSRTAFLSAIALFTLACGGGGSSRSPTEPPSSGPPVSLLGTWTGSMQVQRQGGGSTSCTLTVTHDEEDQGVFFGSSHVSCPGGAFENGLVNSSPFLNQVLVVSLTLPATNNPKPALDGCGWVGQFSRSGDKLTGPWQGGGCNGSSIQGGQIELRKSG